MAESEKDKIIDEGEAQEPETPEEQGIPNLPPVDVYSLLRSFISILGMHAWQWLGLVKNPVTGELERDLAQAKIAIDSIVALSGKLEGKISESEQRDLQGMISDLQINFVQQSAKES